MCVCVCVCVCVCWCRGSREEESKAIQVEKSACTKAQRSVSGKLPVIQTSIIIRQRGECRLHGWDRGGQSKSGRVDEGRETRA